MRTVRLAVLAFALSFTASAASAGTLSIFYAFSGDGFGGVFNGPITGNMTVNLPASSPTVVTTGGAAVLQTFVIQSITSGNDLLLTGFLPLSLVVAPGGNGFQAQAGSVAGYSISGIINFTVFDLVAGAVSGYVNLARHTSIMTPSGGTTLSILTQSFTFSGAEVSRTFMPEPATASMLAMGLFGASLVGGAGTFLRRRR